jgi:hypothetical protein
MRTQSLGFTSGTFRAYAMTLLGDVDVVAPHAGARHSPIEHAPSNRALATGVEGRRPAYADEFAAALVAEATSYFTTSYNAQPRRWPMG